MHKGISAIYLIISATLILGLAIAGYKYGYKPEIKQPVQAPSPRVSNQPPVVSPGVLNKDLRTLPQATPFSPPPAVGTTEQVTVLLNKNTFNRGETVEISINNGSDQTIRYLLGPDCGILFERLINGEYKQQAVSLEDGSASLCATLSLNPAENKAVTRKIIDSAPAGTYRIKFQSYSGSVYSQIFQIL